MSREQHVITVAGYVKTVITVTGYAKAGEREAVPKIGQSLARRFLPAGNGRGGFFVLGLRTGRRPHGG